MSGEAPDLIQGVTGFRSFRVKSGGRLFSQFSEHEWGVTETAGCKAVESALDPGEPLIVEHRPPVKDCGCGLHAYYDLGSVSHLFFASLIDAEFVGCATALVVGEGVLVPHPDGFRAERMSICALSGGPVVEEAAFRLGALYTADRPELDSLALLFGGPLPAEMRPEAAGDTAANLDRSLFDWEESDW